MIENKRMNDYVRVIFGVKVCVLLKMQQQQQQKKKEKSKRNKQLHI